MAVLAKFGNHHAGAAAFGVGKFSDFFLQLFPAFGAVVGGGIHAGDFLGVRAVAAIHRFQRVADLANRGTQAHRIDGQRQQIAGVGLGCRSDSSQGKRDLDIITF